MSDVRWQIPGKNPAWGGIEIQWSIFEQNDGITDPTLAGTQGKEIEEP